MQIENIFAKDIHRPINGVVKVDQKDEFITWQELEEYVVTRELYEHFKTFFDAYTRALEQNIDPGLAGEIGIWVSGFFGSGKSHFLKILSYILENRLVTNPETGEQRRAIEFFKDKIQDPMLYAEMKRVAELDNDVVLFNIDSRADPGEGRKAILLVLWKVFNEMQGFCPDYPYIAEIEKYLSEKNCYKEFQSAFAEITGTNWIDERDAFDLYEDEVVQALARALSREEDKTRAWVNNLRSNFSITVDGLAKQVREYLNRCGPDKRLIFFIDEVGQFIGTDTHLMLNLQTITEDLGRLCSDRAWIVVTSQEDVDSIIGDLPSSQANDFSKIQGRFKTRLTLSSANTDEVIQKRLLKKKKQALPSLNNLFQEKGDILKSQLSFSSDNPSLKNFTDQDHFAVNYPFIPFQFQLMQKVFESIRKVGATGKHLAMGERSMLDAFQSAAKSIADREVGALVPLYAFYKCIESFLDTAIKRSVDQAWDHPGLKTRFDVKLLQTLFLIRYVDILRPNVDNLVTLSIEEVDTDRLSLKKEIEASLQRLERENLINRSGSHYFFLTNEEREVNREIRSTELLPGEESYLIGEIVFNDLFKEKNKIRYQPNQRDYAFQRICDGKVFGGRGEYELAVEVITPRNDEYADFHQNRCILHTGVENSGRFLLILPERQDYLSEIRILKQTDKYVRNKADTVGTPTFKRILQSKQEENQERRKRLVNLLNEALPEARMYALGNTFEPEPGESRSIIDQGLEYLIQNIYNKFNYLTKITSDPVKEIKYILTADDVAQGKLIQDSQGINSKALNEVWEYIRMKRLNNQPVILSELKDRFAGRPYGWPEWEVILLVARMFRSGDLDLILDGARQEPKGMVTPLTQPRQWRNIKVNQRVRVNETQLKQAKEAGKEIFGQIGPDSQEQLAGFLRSRFSGWKQQLESFKRLADTGRYPGGEEIAQALALLDQVLKIQDSYELVLQVIKSKDQLLDISEDLQELQDFYSNQISTWEELLKSMDRFRPNRNILEQYAEASGAMQNLQSIYESKCPYNQIKNIKNYISQVEEVNQQALQEERESALASLDGTIEQIKQLLDQAEAEADLRNQSLYPVQQIRQKIENESSIPDIRVLQSQAAERFIEARDLIAQKTSPDPDPDPNPKPKKVKQISLANLGTKSVLESEEDVNAYLEKIRKTLLEAIKQEQRVVIK